MQRFLARLEDIQIPRTAGELAGFRDWACSDDFPENGRIDFLDGEIEVDMSPEELGIHGLVKAEIAAVLQFLVARKGIGNVYIDRGRVSNPAANLSVEPDIVVVFWDTIDAGRTFNVPSKRRPGRFVEMEGSPDLVVEIVSDGSVRKDLIRLPPLYAKAGIPELWLVDARGETIRFEIHRLVAGRYEIGSSDAEGWIASPRLGWRFRLQRREVRPGRWSYRLEHKAGRP